MAKQNINFDSLVSQIETTNEVLQNNARLVINRHVTANAWLTGCYIVEYEQKGSDRAKYGDRLLQKLAERLNKSNFSYRSLKLYKQFYLTYKPLNAQISSYVMSQLQIRQTPSAQLFLPGNKEFTIGQSVSAQYVRSGWSQKPEALADLVDGLTQTRMYSSQSTNLTFLPKNVWQNSCARRMKDLIRRTDNETRMGI